MIHPHTGLRLISETIGYGVVATQFIPRGTLTWVKDDLDQTFSPEQFQRLSELYHQAVDRYMFVDHRGQFILCWDNARFVNHSCEANCMGGGYDFEIAIHDIQPGEELLDEYGTLNLIENFPCSCASTKCRKTVRRDDVMEYAELWDKLFLDAFWSIPKVEQQLWPFFKQQEYVEAILARQCPPASCRRNHHPIDLQHQAVPDIALK